MLKSKIESGLVSIGEIDSDKNATSNISSSKYSIKDIQEKVKFLLLNARIFDKALLLENILDQHQFILLRNYFKLIKFLMFYLKFLYQ